MKKSHALICFLCGFVIMSIFSSLTFALGLSLLLIGVKEM